MHICESAAFVKKSSDAAEVAHLQADAIYLSNGIKPMTYVLKTCAREKRAPIFGTKFWHRSKQGSIPN